MSVNQGNGIFLYRSIISDRTMSCQIALAAFKQARACFDDTDRRMWSKFKT